MRDVNGAELKKGDDVIYWDEANKSLETGCIRMIGEGMLVLLNGHIITISKEVMRFDWINF